MPEQWPERELAGGNYSSKDFPSFRLRSASSFPPREHPKDRR
jgi:hypothetical protein